MRLVLVRHGIAVDHAKSDFDRQLSPEGRERTAEAMRGLSTMLEDESVVLASPYLRAAETAEILVREAKLAPPETCPALTFAGSRDDILRDARAHYGKPAVVLVGHEPILGSLASWLLTGGEGVRVHVKKASAMAIDFAGPLTVGMGSLAWFLSPKVLRRLR